MAWFPTDPHSVTAEWLSEVLSADVRACRLEQIGIGIGVLGRVYRVHLDGRGVPDTVVVKLPTLDPQGLALCEDLNFYSNEVNFYREIGVDDPLRPPHHYYAAFDPATHEFILVLEDLGRLRVNDQLAGCSPTDAETVIDAIAGHHAYWWESARLAHFPWLRTFKEPPSPAVVARNFTAAWPVVLDRFDDQLCPEMRSFGERLPSLIPWYADEFTRAPHTFLHGDLRLDQLFFAVEPDDPPVTALDWQISTLGRGAYDLAYFLSQSLTIETRRSCEADLVERYRQQLAERGIDYPAADLLHDYRLTTAWCFIYPVLGVGRFQAANERQVHLLRKMLQGSIAAIDDHDALSLRPD